MLLKHCKIVTFSFWFFSSLLSFLFIHFCGLFYSNRKTVWFSDSLKMEITFYAFQFGSESLLIKKTYGTLFVWFFFSNTWKLTTRKSDFTVRFSLLIMSICDNNYATWFFFSKQALKSRCKVSNTTVSCWRCKYFFLKPYVASDWI